MTCGNKPYTCISIYPYINNIHVHVHGFYVLTFFVNCLKFYKILKYMILH